MNAIDSVTATLTICADTLGDIVPAVYARFFASSEEGRALMEHSDQYMQGRMFEQVVGLLTSDEAFEPEGYLDWELKNHLDDYNATAAMYEAFFEAVMQVVRDGVGSAWTARDTSAWRDRIDHIMERVNAPSPG